ncbi:MAG: radical SAM protein [candidate division Zixibacteria bacterium SM23_81]|nr:MAG: radical SAM protein [candidate division Zixibacteria bacterium SM23_81]
MSKRPFKVVLAVPPGGYLAERWAQGQMMPALGLSYLAAVLEQEKVEVQLLPCHVLGLSWGQIREEIARDKPDMVGITTTTENRFFSFRLAEIAKEAHPPACVVLGGPHMNATASDTLIHMRAVDVVALGEGEDTIVDLVKAMREGGHLSKVPGLAYRDGENVAMTPQRPLIPDLDRLPLPARHLEPWDRYNCRMDVPGEGILPAANMMTSRGCPFSCNFCATPTNWGRKVRGFSPERVLSELEHLVQRYQVQVVWFYDDTFNYNPQRLDRICDLLVERNLDIKWYCEIRVDLLDKASLEKMVRSGCYYLGFGVETASERISREIIGKKASLKKGLEVIDWCREFGITANPFFIFSHPTETWSEAVQTMEVIEAIKDRCDVSASILHVYPGTPLEVRARREGQLPQDFSWSLRNFKHVIVIPAAQGHVPLYKDQLTWSQICELMLRFSQSTKKISLLKKVPKVLKSLYSLADVRRYLIMLWVFLLLKASRIFGSSGRTFGRQSKPSLRVTTP